jgi:hypothetical protein
MGPPQRARRGAGAAAGRLVAPDPRAGRHKHPPAARARDTGAAGTVGRGGPPVGGRGAAATRDPATARRAAAGAPGAAEAGTAKAGTRPGSDPGAVSATGATGPGACTCACACTRTRAGA